MTQLAISTSPWMNWLWAPDDAATGVGVTVVSARKFERSGLTRAVLRGGDYVCAFAFGDLAAGMLTALASPGRQLVYGYHADLDAMGHVYGPGSPQWRLQLTQVDRLVKTIATRMPPDALLAVTGDHGMVTMDHTIDADTHPDLRAGVRTLSGEPRARHAHAEPGAAADVLATWRTVLATAPGWCPGNRPSTRAGSARCRPVSPTGSGTWSRPHTARPGCLARKPRRSCRT